MGYYNNLSLEDAHRTSDDDHYDRLDGIASLPTRRAKRQRYTLLVSGHGSEWAKVYDGSSSTMLLRHFCHWASQEGHSLLVVCPHGTDPLLDATFHKASIDIRYY